MKRGMGVFVIAAGLLSSTAASAVEVWTIGHGNNKTCADFIRAAGDISPGAFETDKQGFESPNESFINWAYGYISAINTVVAFGKFRHTSQVEPLSAAGIDRWLRDWCRRNLDQSFSNSVNEYLRDQGVSVSTMVGRR